MQDFKQLDIWRKVLDFSKDIYKITENSPKTEIYGITSQIRMVVVSIGCNIAEGCGIL